MVHYLKRVSDRKPFYPLEGRSDYLPPIKDIPLLNNFYILWLAFNVQSAFAFTTDRPISICKAICDWSVESMHQILILKYTKSQSKIILTFKWQQNVTKVSKKSSFFLNGPAFTPPPS